MTYVIEVCGQPELLEKRVNTLPSGMEMFESDQQYLCFTHSDRNTLETYVTQTYGDLGSTHAEHTVGHTQIL